MSRSCHDLKVIMACLSPVVNCGVPEIVESEILNSCFSAYCLMCSPNGACLNWFPISMKNSVKVYRSYLHGLLQNLHQFRVERN